MAACRDSSVSLWTGTYLCQKMNNGPANHSVQNLVSWSQRWRHECTHTKSIWHICTYVCVPCTFAQQLPETDLFIFHLVCDKSTTDELVCDFGSRFGVSQKHCSRTFTSIRGAAQQNIHLSVRTCRQLFSLLLIAACGSRRRKAMHFAPATSTTWTFCMWARVSRTCLDIQVTVKGALVRVMTSSVNARTCWRDIQKLRMELHSVPCKTRASPRRLSSSTSRRWVSFGHQLRAERRSTTRCLPWAARETESSSFMKLSVNGAYILFVAL